MALFYFEWCHENGLDYDKQESRDAWRRYVDAEMRQPRPTPMPRLSGRITRTWMQRPRSRTLAPRQAHNLAPLPPPHRVTLIPCNCLQALPGFTYDLSCNRLLNLSVSHPSFRALGN